MTRVTLIADCRTSQSPGNLTRDWLSVFALGSCRRKLPTNTSFQLATIYLTAAPLLVLLNYPMS
jgi:hypothetical protein